MSICLDCCSSTPGQLPHKDSVLQYFMEEQNQKSLIPRWLLLHSRGPPRVTAVGVWTLTLARNGNKRLDKHELILCSRKFAKHDLSPRDANLGPQTQICNCRDHSLWDGDNCTETGAVYKLSKMPLPVDIIFCAILWCIIMCYLLRVYWILDFKLNCFQEAFLFKTLGMVLGQWNMRYFYLWNTFHICHLAPISRHYDLILGLI